jgi:hypothetical protein
LEVEALEWINILEPLTKADGISQLITVIQANPDLLNIGMVPLVSMFFAWRFTFRRARRKSLPTALVVTIVRVVGTVAVLVVGLLLALGRSAGRSQYRW